MIPYAAAISLMAKVRRQAKKSFLNSASSSASLYIKPYFGLILSLLGSVLSSAADARCGASMAVSDLDACRRCCYGYRCLLLQPTLSINKEMSHLPSQSSVFVLRQLSYHQASGQPK
jgi:hypothetical protein